MKAPSSLRLAAITHFFSLLLGFLLGLPLNLEVSSEGTLRSLCSNTISSSIQHNNSPGFFYLEELERLNRGFISIKTWFLVRRAKSLLKGIGIARDLPTSLSTDVRMSILQDWQSECELHHHGCPKPKETPKALRIF